MPMDKSGLGLHAWGNVVPACVACSAKKQGRDWRDCIIERAGPSASERYARMKRFLDEYGYRPIRDYREVADEPYEKVGTFAMTLICAKARRMRLRL
jgi:hypothetical protein